MALHQILRCRRYGLWKPTLHIRKKLRIPFQIDKLHILLSRRRLHRQRQNHRQVLLRINGHAINQQLPAIRLWSPKNIRPAYRDDRLRKATHKILSLKVSALELLSEYQLTALCKSED